MRLLAVLLLALCLVGVRSSPFTKRTSSPLELLSIIRLEEACVRQGGICMREEDCPPTHLVNIRGLLCPTQKQFGIECCYAN